MAKKNGVPSRHQEIVVFDDADLMIRAFVERWIASARKALIREGKFTAALSGGHTPVPFYRALGRSVAEIIWQNSHLFLADERHVAPDHPDSNWGMIRREILTSVFLDEGHQHPVSIGETAEASASQYEKELKRFFSHVSGFPAIDLLVLGLGTDGHVASLFPGDAALAEKRRWCVAAGTQDVKHRRISLTFPVIRHAREILYLIRGEEKAGRVRQILVDRDRGLPATRAQSRKGQTVYLLDRAAASRLP